MAPFSAHRIALGALLPDLVAFAGGGHLFVEGRFDSRGLFTRPYVFSEGERSGAYHGGDRYHWPALPAFAYKLLGDGELNPIAAIHRPDLTTVVNVLHSHGERSGSWAVEHLMVMPTRLDGAVFLPAGA